MAVISDRDVLTRIYQIQDAGGGDNEATRAQIAQEAIAAGVGASQIARAMDLARADAGVTDAPPVSAQDVAGLASDVGYDLDTFSDRTVLDRIYQIQAEGGGDNPATRAQIAQEAIDAGVGAGQISRALTLAAQDAGVESGFTSGGTRVSNIASGIGYDLGAPSPLIDIDTISDLQAAQAGLYAGDFGMPSYEEIMRRLYSGETGTGETGTGGTGTGGTGTDRPGVQTPGLIGTGVIRTTDPLYETPSTGFEYDTPTELIDPETGEFVSTGELMAQNVAQGPLTQSMEQITTPSEVEGEAPTVSYDYVPFDPTTSQPIVTALPTVTASDFLFSGAMRQPELGPVNNTFAQNLASVMNEAPFNDPLVYGDLNGDGVVNQLDADMYRSMYGPPADTENTALYSRGGYVQSFARGGEADGPPGSGMGPNDTATTSGGNISGGGGDRDEGGRSYSIESPYGTTIDVVDFSRNYTGPRLADGTPDPYGTGQGLNLSTDRLDYGDDPDQVLRDLRTFEARKMNNVFNRMLGAIPSDSFNTYMQQFQQEQRAKGVNTNPVSRFAERVSRPVEVGPGRVSLGKVPGGGFGVTYTQDLYPGDIAKGVGSLFNALMTQEDQNR